MSRKLLPDFILVCSLVLGFLSTTNAVILEVKDVKNVTCIRADISANFTIKYLQRNNTTKTVVVPLPESAQVGKGSSCTPSPDLTATFGNGHSLSLVFFSDNQTYSVSDLTLAYNLSDNATFPNSTSNETITLSSKTSGISARINTTYRCMSPNSVELNKTEVIATFYKIHLQAYMQSANMSVNETVCSADVPSTTLAPTTTPVSPTTPVPPSNPEKGNYTVENGTGAACLIALMGLQMNVTYFSKSQNKTVVAITNIEPNTTTPTGVCESTTATLRLTAELTNITFMFTLNTNTSKYQLTTVNVSANWKDMAAPLMFSNSSLQYMEATLGHSYMCKVEETLFVVTNFSLNTFDLQVQPFGVHDNKFGPADVCRMQKDSMLVPIIVGACLAALVLIVLIAYLVGRKRSHAGYQTI